MSRIVMATIWMAFGTDMHFALFLGFTMLCLYHRQVPATASTPVRIMPCPRGMLRTSSREVLGLLLLLLGCLVWRSELMAVALMQAALAEGASEPQAALGGAVGVQGLWQQVQQQQQDLQWVAIAGQAAAAVWVLEVV